jgi:hypothetical protein
MACIDSSTSMGENGPAYGPWKILIALKKLMQKAMIKKNEFYVFHIFFKFNMFSDIYFVFGLFSG